MGMDLAWDLMLDVQTPSLAGVILQAAEATGLQRSPELEMPALLTDNGPGYISRAMADCLAMVGLHHLHDRPQVRLLDRVSSDHGARQVKDLLLDIRCKEQLGHLSWLDLFVAHPSQRPRVATPQMRERVIALARELRHEVEQRGRGWESAVRLNLLMILFTVSRDWDPPVRGKVPSRSRASSLPRIMPALDMVQSRLARRVTVTEAADACALGRAQFCRIFRDAMGMSFGRFCQRSRLGHVAELLLSTDLTVSDIAERAGFADGSHMHRAFANHHGCAPGEYRAQNRPH
jgi:AraC-like DNA-binding protein